MLVVTVSLGSKRALLIRRKATVAKSLSEWITVSVSNLYFTISLVGISSEKQMMRTRLFGA